MEAAVDVLFMAKTSTSEAPISLRKGFAFCKESIFGKKQKNHNRNVQKEIFRNTREKKQFANYTNASKPVFFSAFGAPLITGPPL